MLILEVGGAVEEQGDECEKQGEESKDSDSILVIGRPNFAVCSFHSCPFCLFSLPTSPCFALGVKRPVPGRFGNCSEYASEGTNERCR